MHTVLLSIMMLAPTADTDLIPAYQPLRDVEFGMRLYHNDVRQVGHHLVVDKSRGGNILYHLDAVLTMEQRGDDFVINGPCLSACAMAVDTAQRTGVEVCVTPNALFGYHQARRFVYGYEPYPYTYQPKVEAWISSAGGLKPKMAIMGYETAVTLYPKCSAAVLVEITKGE